MTVTLELSPDEEASLTAQAQTCGLTVQQWLLRLAKQSAPLQPLGKEADPDDDRPIWEIIIEDVKDVPPEEMAALPKDGASQIDHYVYGVPKREA